MPLATLGPMACISRKLCGVCLKPTLCAIRTAETPANAPMAKALLGKQVDDDVKVLTPDGEVFYTVTSIRYTG